MLAIVLALNRQVPYLNFLARGLWRESAIIFIENQRAAFLNLWHLQPDRAHSRVPTLELTVADNTFVKMQEALKKGSTEQGHEEDSDRPYFSGFYKDESGEWQDCKVSLRGALSHHHDIAKPSLRVKIRQQEIRLGSRYVELVRLEEPLGTTNWLADQMADELGLPNPRTEIVRLYVNGKYKGVYQRSLRPGEDLAVKNGRMPGLMVKGDDLERNEDMRLWRDSGQWRSFGDADPRYLAVFQRLLDSLDADAPLEAFWEHMDFEALAAWSAITISCHSSHTDFFHNHVLYFNPIRGKFEPMPWDTNAFLEDYRAYGNKVPIDLISSPLINKAMRDPRWMQRRNEILHELAVKFCAPGPFAERIDRHLGTYWDDLLADEQLMFVERRAIISHRMRPVPVSDLGRHRAFLLAANARRHAEITNYLDRAAFSLRAKPGDPSATQIRVYGYVALRVRSGAGMDRILHPGLALGQPNEHDQRFVAQAAALDYELDAPAASLVFENAVTGRPVQARPWASEMAGEELISVRPADAPKVQRVVSLGPGEIRLERNLVVEGHEKLLIEPGTTILLAANVQIVSMGVVEALGSAGAPIILRAASAKTWDSFSIAGPAASGSRLGHVSISGGTRGFHRGAFFRGMFNIYNCRGVEISHCRFSGNTRGQPSMNIAESGFSLSDSAWSDCAGVVLDIDMSKGGIRQCTFSSNDTDGIDLSASEVTVESCTFSGHGGIGTAIGEGSRATLRDCRFDACKTGVEVRDFSRAQVLASTFLANGGAVRATRKSWTHVSGGLLYMRYCKISGSTGFDADIGRESHASIVPAEGLRIEGPEQVSRAEESFEDWLRGIYGKHMPWLGATN